ncbi:hypothetical protein GR216_35955 [Rhizobium leguminosarum]|nr:hypothetical protein [Rhizobium ruizarguesonis]NEJ40509.1 hypothetical protein [Rhizobium ruizarguesonis]
MLEAGSGLRRASSDLSTCGGETFQPDAWSFEIIDMDGRRIDKILAKCIRGE